MARPERRSPTGIARERETRTDDPWSAGQLSRWGPPTGIARERETRADDPWSAALTLSRWGSPTGIARERETRADDAVPRQCESRVLS